MSTTQAKQKRNRILSWAINLAGILAFGLILWLGGVEAWQQIVEGDWRYVLAALGVTLLWNLVAAFRWSLIANRGRRRQNLRLSLLFYLPDDRHVDGASGACHDWDAWSPACGP